MSHLRDLFVTDNIGAVSARGHSGDIAAITHMGKKKKHALGWMRKMTSRWGLGN